MGTSIGPNQPQLKSVQLLSPLSSVSVPTPPPPPGAVGGGLPTILTESQPGGVAGVVQQHSDVQAPVQATTVDFGQIGIMPPPAPPSLSAPSIGPAGAEGTSIGLGAEAPQ